ncbi:MAG: MotA/TolQ/ExbB proton channel family protein [Pirellulales bacterium]
MDVGSRCPEDQSAQLVMRIPSFGRFSVPICAAICFTVCMFAALPADAQVAEPPADSPRTSEIEDLAAAASRNRSEAAKPQAPQELSFLELLKQGGVLMIPIGIMSVLVTAVTIERFFSLQGGRILPRRLRSVIVDRGERGEPIDPQELYQVSLKYSSVAGRVLESMLCKVGRPVNEIESTLDDACQREADRMYSSVRWLSMSAGVAPLIGLLGTVWGMILAFFNTTQLAPGSNRAEQLSEGIYVAFVNTLGGLAVAIPAAIFAHYFEGRVLSQIARVRNVLSMLLPKMERFEGKVRYDLTPVGLVQRKEDLLQRREEGGAAANVAGSTSSSSSAEAADRDLSASGARRAATSRDVLHGSTSKPSTLGK